MTSKHRLSKYELNRCHSWLTYCSDFLNVRFASNPDVGQVSSHSNDLLEALTQMFKKWRQLVSSLMHGIAKHLKIIEIHFLEFFI